MCSAIAGVSCGGHGFIFHGSCLHHVNKCCVVCMCTDFKPMSCMYVATCMHVYADVWTLSITVLLLIFAGLNFREFCT